MDKENHTNRYYTRAIKALSILTKGISRNHIVGLENLPLEGSVIVAPNHISNIDPVLIGVKLSARRQIHALAKESLFRAPVIGSVLRNMGHIPVHRGTSTASESLTAARETLESGGAVAIYPEGTIPRDTLGKLGSFKTGVARLAEQTGAPVLPVGQWGAQNILPVNKNTLTHLLKSVFLRPKHYTIVGEPLTRADYSSTELFNTALKETIASLVEQARMLTEDSTSDR